eukprot:COSAG05_NODE_1798_length_4039_cov_7.678086_2_plen_56_part_00
MCLAPGVRGVVACSAGWRAPRAAAAEPRARRLRPAAAHDSIERKSMQMAYFYRDF